MIGYGLFHFLLGAQADITIVGYECYIFDFGLYTLHQFECFFDIEGLV